MQSLYYQSDGNLYIYVLYKRLCGVTSAMLFSQQEIARNVEDIHILVRNTAYKAYLVINL